MKLYKYTFRSPLCGSIHCEQVFKQSDGVQELTPNAMAVLYDRHWELNEFLTKNSENLTDCISEAMTPYVHKVEVGDYAILDGRMYLRSYVWAKTNLTQEQLDEVKSWISGQYSDGWGEGLEQREWMTLTTKWEVPEYDPQECQLYMAYDECEALFYVHPWSGEHFDLVLEDTALEEVADAQPTVHASVSTLMPNGGYKVRTVYKFYDADDAIACIKNSDHAYSYDFIERIENRGCLGCAIEVFTVCVNEGLFTQFPPIMGVIDNDLHFAKLYIEDVETGLIEEHKYQEDEYTEFYNALITK